MLMKLFNRSEIQEPQAEQPSPQARLAELDTKERRWLGILTGTDHSVDMIAAELKDIEAERATILDSQVEIVPVQES
jgi:hypothetical protein